MKIDGGGQGTNNSTGVIQAGSVHNSVIFQLIDSVQKPTDVDRAIGLAETHLNRLRRKKSWQDAQVLLVIIATLSIMVGVNTGWPHSLIFYSGAVVAVIIDCRLNKKFNSTNSQISAAQELLTEFYKIKLNYQLHN